MTRGVSELVSTEVRPDLSWYRAALLVVIALCTYLPVPLMAGERVLVPSFPTVALAPLLFLAVRPNLSTADVVFVLKVALVLLLSIALSPGYAYIQQKLFSLIQCCMALAVAVLIVRLMQQISRGLLERALLLVWCLIVTGAVLEVLGVISEQSDSFRAWAYEGAYTIYYADLRDIELVGWPRPKLFSVEPSHVTKIFVASINAWLLLRVRWAKVVVVAAATLVMLVIMGSPMLLMSAALTLAIVMWDRRARLGARVIMVLGVLLFAGLFGAYYGESTYSTVAGRVERAGDSMSNPQSGGGSSEKLRIVYPYMTLADTWLRFPLFGVGIGGKEVVAEHNTLPVERPEMALGNNVMAEIGIFLGVVGATWFLWLLLMQARQSGVHRVGMMLLIVALFSQLMGGLVSFQYWGYIALLWGALAVADSAQTDR